VGLLRSLRAFSGYANRFTGSIPVEFGACENLESLVLHANRLCLAVPDSLAQLSKLSCLNLACNNLDYSDFVPPWVYRLVALTDLDLSVSEICQVGRNQSGAIVSRPGHDAGRGATHGLAEELGRLVHLKRLKCDNTRMGGTIPGALCGLAQLQVLRLRACELTGSVPAEIGRLSMLQVKGYWNALCRPHFILILPVTTNIACDHHNHCLGNSGAAHIRLLGSSSTSAAIRLWSCDPTNSQA
jgi:hypothetical protein